MYIIFIHFAAIFESGRWRELNSFQRTPQSLSQYVKQMPGFCLNSRAKSTQRNYRYAFNTFCRWCKIKNLKETLPASDVCVASYLIHLTNTGKSTSSLNEAFYAISWAHRLAGVVNPCESDLVVTVKEGSLRSVGHSICKKEPITPNILNDLVVKYSSGYANLKDIRLVCMCLLAYAGFLRYSELANLKRNHIYLYDTYVKLFLETSKTDVYREGREVLISKTNNSTCPVNMLKRYLLMANIEPKSNDFIFRPLIFCKSNSTYKLRHGSLSYTTARELLLDALGSLGLDKKSFGLHSLRSGGATAVAASNVEDRLFKKHGRWKSDQAKDGYVKESLDKRLAVTKNLGI